MRRFLLSLLLSALAMPAAAIVIRDDVDDAQYRVPASTFPALVDMPGQGHGVLIAPDWVITAAHTLPMHTDDWQVLINGVPRQVERTVVHEGYRTLPDELVEPAMASGEAMLIVVFLSAMDDIALVKLREPVTDVAPVALYRDSELIGQTVRLVGKGATGNGASGHDPRGPNRTGLRQAFNQITSAYGRWFCYVFDAPPAALPLEGILGNGDSGGPVLVERDGQWQLAGVAAWKVVEGHVMTTRPGRYGQITCNVRLAHYLDWIDGVMAAESTT